jgi:hypothetical protein
LHEGAWSQSLPVKPGRQVQLKPGLISAHVPMFWQGLGEHRLSHSPLSPNDEFNMADTLLLMMLE